MDNGLKMRRSKNYDTILFNAPLISDKTRTLIYDMDKNYFFDEFGYPVYDIHRLVTPTQIMLFMKQGNAVRHIFRDVTNSFLVELLYE